MNEDTIVQHKGTWGQCERKFVKQLIKKERIQLLCVQETNKEVMDNCLCSSLWGDGELEWVALPSLGASRGLLCIWDPKFFVAHRHFLGVDSLDWKVCGKIMELK